MKLGVEEVKTFAKYFASHVGFAAAGWILGRFNYGLTALFLVGALYSWHITFQKARKHKAALSQNFFKNEREAIQSIFEDVPRWVFFPDIERAEWLNKVTEQLWPNITAYIHDYMKNNLELTIRDCLPSHLKSFQFEQIDFGDLPPKIAGVRTYEHHTGSDEIILDIDMFYAGDANISLSVSKLKAGIKSLQIRGTCRVVMKPLIDRPPFIAGLQVFMLSRPTLRFDLTSAASVLEIPGLYQLLQEGILSSLSTYLVLPNHLSIPLTSAVPVSELKVLEPKGVLRVTLVEAKELKGSDLTSKSDPYAVLCVGCETYRSSTVKDNNDPIWRDQIFMFTVIEVEGVSLDVSMFDDDSSSSDDAIGGVSIPLTALREEGHVDTWRSLGEDYGSVHLICDWMNLTSDPTEVSNISKELKPSSVVCVYVDSAKNVVNPLTPTVQPTSKVRLTVGPVRQHTKPVRATPNPNFQENFSFLLNDPKLDKLRAEVIDVKAERVIGACCVALTSCLDASDMTLEVQPFALRSSQTDSEIHMRVAIKKLIPVQKATDKLPTSNAAATGTRRSSAPNLLDAEEPMTRQRASTMDNKPRLTGRRPGRRSAGSSPARPNMAANEMGLLDRRRKSQGDALISGTNKLNRSANVGVKAWTPDLDRGLGQIQLSFHYSSMEDRLKVTIHQCKLPKAPYTKKVFYRKLRMVTDTYVKVYLMPDKESKKTQIVKDSANPTYNESFEFEVDYGQLTKKHLEVTVKSYESVFSREEIGEVHILLADFKLTPISTRWFPLCPKGRFALFSTLS